MDSTALATPGTPNRAKPRSSNRFGMPPAYDAAASRSDRADGMWRRVRGLPIAVLAAGGVYAIGAALFWVLSYLGPIGFLLLALLLLTVGGVGGARLCSWWWPVIYPLPLAGLGAWLLQAQTWYEQGEVGSFAAAILYFMGILFLVLAVIAAVVAAVGVAIGKHQVR